MLRRSLHLPDAVAVAPGSDWSKLETPTKRVSADWRGTFAPQHNPVYPAHRGVRVNTWKPPSTRKPHVPKPKTLSCGERPAEAISLPPYLQDAYTLAEEFCHFPVGRQDQGAGFLKTLLLRRVEAPCMPAGRPLTPCSAPGSRLPTPRRWKTGRRTLHVPYPTERATLQAFIDTLEANQERDPVRASCWIFSLGRHWLDQGCIIFSQYFDSIWWLKYTNSHMTSPQR